MQGLPMDIASEAQAQAARRTARLAATGPQRR